MNLAVALATDPVAWRRIEARGEDAVTFLQGQLSGDLLGAAPVGALLLTPAGDVVSSLQCLLVDSGVDLVVRQELAETVVGSLQRFLLRTRCSLAVAELVTGPYRDVGEQIDLGEPGPTEFAPGVAPQTFGDDFVHRHVSFTKGCFTGQELVGRLDARGSKVPFRLARVVGEDLATMQRVVRDAGPQGERALQGLTTVVSDSTHLRGLALVHRSLAPEGRVTIDGVEVTLVGAVA